MPEASWGLGDNKTVTITSHHLHFNARKGDNGRTVHASQALRKIKCVPVLFISSMGMHLIEERDHIEVEMIKTHLSVFYNVVIYIHSLLLFPSLLFFGRW